MWTSLMSLTIGVALPIISFESLLPELVIYATPLLIAENLQGIVVDTLHSQVTVQCGRC